MLVIDTDPGVDDMVALLAARRLQEPQAASMEQLLRELLLDSPQRFWLRLWPRG